MTFADKALIVKFCIAQGLHKDNHRFLGRATANNHDRYATL
jgi:hypothetical protein